jgi:hypothetical protein
MLLYVRLKDIEVAGFYLQVFLQDFDILDFEAEQEGWMVHENLSRDVPKSFRDLVF